MTKHTPGPWFGEQRKSRNGERYFIGNTTTAVVELGPIENWDDEDHADATLIAAAPDLLEAAEAVDKYWMKGYQLRNATFMEALVGLQAAIAKAKGERHE